MTPGSVPFKVSNFIAANKRSLEKFAVGENDFSRSRKLGIVHLVGHVIFLAAQRNQNGYAITSQNYFYELGAVESSVARSSFCEARQKLDWKAFEFLLTKLSQKECQKVKWKGLNVTAIDGTSLTLPATENVLEKFPRLTAVARLRSHYPKGKLVTAMNIFTGQPTSAIIDDAHGSERKCLSRLLGNFKNEVLLLDRGFEGFDSMEEIAKHKLFFVVRIRAKGRGLKIEVKNFIASRKKTSIVTIRKNESELRVRLIRGKVDREGSPIILATNLMGRKTYSSGEICDLYLARWKIETMYFRVKELLKLEKFHAKTVNGVLQEIWANLVFLSLTAMMTCLAKPKIDLQAPNFKAATDVIRRNFSFFICAGKRTRLEEMLAQIIAIQCVKQPGRKNPRLSKQPYSHWVGGRKNRLINNLKLNLKKKIKMTA